GKCYARRRAAEFRKFLDEIEAAVPRGPDVYLVMANYATHKAPLIRKWLAERPCWHTPSRRHSAGHMCVAALYELTASLRALAASQTRPHQQEDQARRGDPLCTLTLAGLCCFIDDGRIEIDSNVVERTIRPIALNRKNALFGGSDGGAEHWAVIATLIETCKLNGADPYAYLAETITKIVNGHPNARLDELLPWAYPAAAALRNVA